MTKRFQIDDDGDISEFDSNGKWVDCWMYANGKHWNNLCNELNHLNDENEQLKKENEQLNQFKKQVFQIIDDSIKIYEDTTTNDEFLQIQLDTKLQTLYNLQKELLK